MENKDLKTLGILLMVISVGVLIASAALRELALGGVGFACFAIAAASLAKSKSSD